MDVQRGPCSEQAIEQLLAGRLGDQERAVLEDHLERCSGCRDRLDGLAAGGSWWQEARGLLAPAGEPPLPEPAEEPADALGGLGRYLGPTDDPRMLGRLGGYEVAGVVG